MKHITNEIVKRFEQYLYEEEKSNNTIEKYMPASVNSILSSLNSLFIFMGWYELKVKALKIQKKIFIDKEKELTKTEYEKLLTVAKSKKIKRLYYLMQTIASTGLRVSEIKYITCEAVKAGQATINCKGKIRQIFLPKKLCSMLKEFIKKQNIKSGSIFVFKNGKPLDRSNI